MIRTTTALTALGLLAACATEPTSGPAPDPVSSTQARFETVDVAAIGETAPMTGTGDRADDPAIWVNPAALANSLILGTNKDEGLHVYDLSGNEVQFLGVGRLNNVDLRGTLAVASNDELNALSWFTIAGGIAQPVIHLGDSSTGKNEPYGVCLGIVESKPTAAVTYKDGTVDLWTLEGMIDKDVSPELSRTVKLASKLEGCVFDDANARLFIGEEAYGIWSLDLNDPASMPLSVDAIADGNGLVEDTEGLSLWETGDGNGYLVASAQAADRFVVYKRNAPHTPLGVFTVIASADGSVDVVTHTDGLDVVSTPLPGFPRGLLVVQDDGNPASEQDQNFKLVSWADVEAALGLTKQD